MIEHACDTMSGPGIALTTPAPIRTCERGPDMTKRTCRIDGCEKPHDSHGLCNMHARRMRNGLPLDAPVRKRHDSCSVDGCPNPHTAGGFCSGHYQQNRKRGTVAPLRDKQTRLELLLQLIAIDTQECINWPRPAVEYPYVATGNSRSANKWATTTNRFACEAAHGPPPTDKHQAAHSCGNRICVNPRHLRWATCLENAHDKLLHGTRPRGEAHYAATISDATAVEIAERYAAGGIAQAALGVEYGISQSSVARIVSGKRNTALTPQVKR